MPARSPAQGTSYAGFSPNTSVSASCEGVAGAGLALAGGLVVDDWVVAAFGVAELAAGAFAAVAPKAATSSNPTAPVSPSDPRSRRIPRPRTVLRRTVMTVCIIRAREWQAHG